MGIMLTIKQLLEKVIGHVCDSAAKSLGKQRFEFWGRERPGMAPWKITDPKWGLKGLVRFFF